MKGTSENFLDGEPRDGANPELVAGNSLKTINERNKPKRNLDEQNKI
jgi:hypothetical protein